MVGLAARMPSSPGKLLRGYVRRDRDRFALLVCDGEHLLGAPAARHGPRKKDESDVEQARPSRFWPHRCFLLPLALAYWARAVLGNELSSRGFIAFAAIIGAIFYRIGLDSAVAASHRTRESMLLHLSHSDAPLSVT